MAFFPRSRPEDEPTLTNRNWIKTSYGGYNKCVLIDSQTGSCIPNCVGYCWGRWREILERSPNLSRADAKYWYDHNDEYERSSEPSLGAVICYQGGYGHVAIVEEIVDNDTIITSSSDYGGTRFYIKTLHRADNWRDNHLTNKTFRGFIVNPVVNPPHHGGRYVTYTKLPILYYGKNIRKER